MRVFTGHKAALRGVAYLPDGRTLVTADQGGAVKLWDLASGRETTTFLIRKNPELYGRRLDAIAVSPDGRLLAAAGYTLTVWDLTTGREDDRFESPPDETYRSVAFALRGKHLLTDHSHWNTATGDKTLTPWHPAFVVTIATVTPDDRYVIGRVGVGRVARWNVKTGREYPTQLDTEMVLKMAASPAARVVAAGVYQTVDLRDGHGNRLLARWRAHEKYVNALAFSPDGKLLLTGGNDKVVKLWDVSAAAGVLADPDAKPLRKVPELAAFAWPTGPVRALAFAPDGSTAAAVGDRLKFVVWDVD